MRTSLATRLNAGGLSLAVGTVDENGVPSSSRAVAVRGAEGNRTLTVWVPVATSQATVSNIASNPRVAVVFSEPISHETVQIKGRVIGVQLAPPGDLEHVTGQMGRFGEILDQLGMPRRITSRINRWPAFSIEISIEDVYDQTPGPKAGRAVS